MEADTQKWKISIHAPPRGATLGGSPHCGVGSHFNSRPSARGDQNRRNGLYAAGYFNSRPSARGDSVSVRQAIAFRRFQFTPLREGRPRQVSLRVRAIHFNSRPSARGDSASQQCRASASFQFTPLREGRLNFYREAFDNLIISIHAPPRGATGRCHRVCPAGYFNSRPSARGDIYLAALQGVPREFQFTPLREGRHIGAPKWYNANRISIHAPPRGATGQLFSGKIRFLISIHAPPRGATHPRARRRRTGAYFNSRPSARGDGHPRRAEAWTRQFQFTPLREGRRAEIISPAAPAPFQFTPLREGRRSRLTLTRFSIPFQFTPLREGRRKKTMNTYTFAPKFQFTPLREGRP